MNRHVVIDTETTGLDPYKGYHRVIEIAAIEVLDGIITGKEFHTFLNPEGKKSNQRAFKVHQISDSSLLDKPVFKNIATDFFKFLGESTLVFFNKDFDLKFLQNEVRLANLDIVFTKDFKSRCLMREVAATLGRQRITLDSACKINHIDITKRTKHGALVDTVLTSELLIAVDNTNSLQLDIVPQSKAHSKQVKFPFPRSFNGIQLNFCKNTACANYGIPPSYPKKKADGSYTKGLDKNYRLETKVRKFRPTTVFLLCKNCGSTTRLINNRAFIHESDRIKIIYKFNDPACPNTCLPADPSNNTPDGRRYRDIIKKINRKEVKFKRLLPACENSGLGIIGSPDSYTLDGKNKKQREYNNQKPIISHPRIVDNIFGVDQFDAQIFKCKKCKTKFSAPLNGQKGQKLSQINHQLFVELVNKGIINRIIESLQINPATIYHRIEFFYHQCIQFDQYQLDTNINNISDRELNLSMDRQHFYSNWNDKNDARRTKIVNTTTIDNDTRFVFASTLNFDFTSDCKKIRSEFIKYEESQKLDHQRRYSQYILPNVSEDGETDLKQPPQHLLVQQTYSIMAHLEYLKKYFKIVKQTNLFADDDTGFELSICLVLKDLISENKVSAMLIRNASEEQGSIPKNLNLTRSNDWIPQQNPVVSNKPIDVKFLTNTTNEAYMNASIHGVDNYFQMLRRRLNMLERPIQTQSNSQVWNGYGSYNPKYVSMLVEIFRVYNNYVLTDHKALSKRGSHKTAKTPAQKLGLVSDTFSVYDILEFSPAREFFKQREEITDQQYF